MERITIERKAARVLRFPVATNLPQRKNGCRKRQPSVLD
jgi:hypothetical protein